AERPRSRIGGKIRPVDLDPGPGSGRGETAELTRADHSPGRDSGWRNDTNQAARKFANHVVLSVRNIHVALLVYGHAVGKAKGGVLGEAAVSGKNTQAAVAGDGVNGAVDHHADPAVGGVRD